MTRYPILLIFFILLMTGALALVGQVAGQAQSVQVIDNFQQDKDGDLPSRWRYVHDGHLRPLVESEMRENEWFRVVREGNRSFVRAYTHGEAVHITMGNEPDGFDWDVQEHPVMEWDWRANKLPINAREDHDLFNDSGAAIYVVFDIEGRIIRRPRAIKYVYSSSLPVGTVAHYGKLAVIVASSALDGTGSWTHVTRNVAQDYRDVFRGEPDRRPLSIRLWSDSDNTRTEAEVDFDNIILVPGQ